MTSREPDRWFGSPEWWQETALVLALIGAMVTLAAVATCSQGCRRDGPADTAAQAASDVAAHGGAVAAWAWCDAYLVGLYDRAGPADRLAPLDAMQERAEAARIALGRAALDADPGVYRTDLAAAVEQLVLLMRELEARGARPPPLVLTGLAAAAARSGVGFAP